MNPMIQVMRKMMPPEQVRKKFVTVKRNWEGSPNYFPSSSKFDVYVPPHTGGSCQENWLERVEVRKRN